MCRNWSNEARGIDMLERVERGMSKKKKLTNRVHSSLREGVRVKWVIVNDMWGPHVDAIKKSQLFNQTIFYKSHNLYFTATFPIVKAHKSFPKSHSSTKHTLIQCAIFRGA